MIKQSLNGTWQLRECGAEEWLPGQVPGGVHLDLMAAGRISDPFVGDEELRVGWVAEREPDMRRHGAWFARLYAADVVGVAHTRGLRGTAMCSRSS